MAWRLAVKLFQKLGIRRFEGREIIEVRTMRPKTVPILQGGSHENLYLFCQACNLTIYLE